VSEDCQKCGTAMCELDEDRNCPGCLMNDLAAYSQELGLYDIDLLTTCGTFDTNDCISHEDMRHLFKVKENKVDN
jgi:hypothetical protein